MARKLRLGSTTAGQLIADGQDMLGIYTTEDVTPPLWINTFNRMTAKLHELMGWKNLVEYRDVLQIPILKSLNSLQEPESDFDGDALTLVIPLEGPTWNNSDFGFDEYWVGAEGVLTDTSDNTDYNVRIVSITDANTVVVESIDNVTIPDIAGDDLIANISTDANNEADEIDLTTFDRYKQLDRIEKITYTVTNAARKTETKLAVGPPRVTTKNFEGMSGSQNYSNQVIWNREGEKVLFHRGEDLSTYGLRNAHVVMNPAPILTEDDFIDVRDADVPLVLDATLVYIYISLPPEKRKSPLPQPLMSWYNELFGAKKSTEEEKKVVASGV